MRSILSKKYFTKELLKDCELFFSIFNSSAPVNNSSLLSFFDSSVDPFEAIKEDMENFNYGIIKSLSSETEDLNRITQYYFKHPGKYFRPAVLLALSRSLGSLSSSFSESSIHEAQFVFSQVIEMIHCSSLIHDDVIDKGETRRGIQAIHSIVGNKNAVMGGNYLISTASYVCSRLNDMRLMDYISSIMENLTKGELIQSDSDSQEVDDIIISYVHKTFFKTASLIAFGCKGVGLYGGYPDQCFDFGKHLGLAFQYVDDILDFVGDAKALGKPKLNDMKEGLATGPVIFALKEKPQLSEVISRKFSHDGDIETGLEYAMMFGIDKTRTLALSHLKLALESLEFIKPDTYSYRVLSSLLSKIYTRIK